MFDTVAFALSGTGKEALALSLMQTPRPKSISLPAHPETGLTVELGTKLYLALSETDQIAVIDTLSKTLIGTIDDVGDEPWAITAAGGLGYCH
jgi:YVTN family beta-propeller protein